MESNLKDYRTYVTEEIAIKAIESGFECTPEGSVNLDMGNVGIMTFMRGSKLFQHDGIAYYLPTAEQIVNWLRIEHNIIVSFGTGFNCDYHYQGVAYHDSKFDYGKKYQWHEYDEMVMGTMKIALEMIGE